jgi:hypothetical protein
LPGAVPEPIKDDDAMVGGTEAANVAANAPRDAASTDGFSSEMGHSGRAVEAAGASEGAELASEHEGDEGEGSEEDDISKSVGYVIHYHHVSAF